MPNENANTQTIETPESAPENVTESQPGATGEDTIEPSQSFQVQSDKEQQINSILAKYEKDEEEKKLSSEELSAQKEEEWKQNGMLEGESFQQVYDQADEPTRRVLSEFRKQWTQKTQSLAEEKKEMQSLKEQLLQQQSSLTSSDAYKAMEALAQSASLEGFNFDPFSQDSVSQLIQGIKAQTAKELVAMMEPMRAEQQKAQGKLKAQTYMEQNPELKTNLDLRNLTRDILLKYENMDLPEAHKIAAERLELKKWREGQQLHQQQSEAQKQIGRTLVGNGNQPKKTTPSNKKLSAWDIYQAELKAIGK